MSLNVTDLDGLQLGSIVGDRYVVKKVIVPGKFTRVYLGEDSLYQKDCLLTEIVFRKAGEIEIIGEEIKNNFNDLSLGKKHQSQGMREVFCEGERLLILQKNLEEELPQESLRTLTPLNEYEVVQLLNQVLATFSSKVAKELRENLHNLALTALILLAGKYLYDSPSKTWDWRLSKQISDQRKEVLERMLGSKKPFDKVDEISQALNTVFLPIKKTQFKIPRRWYIVGGIGSLLIVIGVIGLWFSKTPSPLPISSSFVSQCPEGLDVVAIACDVKVIDIDSTNFEQGKLTIKFKGKVTADDRLLIFEKLINTKNTDVENSSNNVSSSDVIAGDQVIGDFVGGMGATPLEINLNSNADAETVKILLSNILYQNVSDTREIGDRTVEFQMTDGDGETSNILKKIVSVNDINQLPFLTVPEAKRINEDSKIIIRGISVKDDDAGNNRITVTLKATNGSLRIKKNVQEGVIWRDIYQEEPGTVSLNGTISQINNTLKAEQAVTYESHPNFYGTETLVVTVNDNGKKVSNPEAIIYPPSALNPKTNRETLSIEVNPINDAPVLGIAKVQKPQTAPSTSTKDPLEQFSSPSTLSPSVPPSGTNATIVGEPGSKNIRTGPGLEYRKRHIAYPGDRVRVIEARKNKDNFTWYHIYFPKSGADGWIAGNLLKVDGQASNQTQPQSQARPRASSTQTNATVSGTSGTKNMRSGPGTNYGVIGTAPTGDRVQIVGSSYDRGGYQWYKVYHPNSGTTGWIAAQLINPD